MSTRATIWIKSESYSEEVRIYHHCDGYPDGIGSDMKAYLKILSDWDVADIANDLIKGNCGKKDMGYEWTTCQHGDEQYGYLIDCDNKTLKCYELGLNVYEWKEDRVVDITD